MLVLAKFGFNFSELLGDAPPSETRQGRRRSSTRPAVRRHARPRRSTSSRSALALVLGTAGLPHILIRFYTVPTARAARTSVLWAIGLIGIVLPDDAGARLRRRRAGRHGRGQRDRRAAAATWPRHCWPRRSAAATGSTGGAILLALISAVAFATILAVVAGLTLTSASSVAHDLYASVITQGRGDRATRRSRSPGSRRFVIGAVAIVLAIPSQGPEHRVPGGAGLRGRGVGEPAVDPLQPVLEAVQHPRRDLGDLRRADHRASGWCSSRRSSPARATGTVAVPRHRLRGSRCSNPGIISIPFGFLWAGSARSPSREAGGRGALRRARGALAHRRRHGEGGRTTDRPPTRRPSASRHVGCASAATLAARPGRIRGRHGGAASRAPAPASLRGASGSGWLRRTTRDEGVTNDDERRVQRADPLQPVARGAPVRPAGRARRATPTSRRRRTTRPPRTGSAFWAEQAERLHLGARSGTPGPRLEQPAVRQVVRRRQAQRRVQLRRPPRRGRPRRPGRLPLGGRARRHPHHHLRRPARTRSARRPTR